MDVLRDPRKRPPRHLGRPVSVEPPDLTSNALRAAEVGKGFINRFTRLLKPMGSRHGALVSNEAEAMPTTSLGFAFAFFVAAFVSTLVGLALRAYLADRLRLDYARDMVGGMTGLVVTLVALVFGLLIWTAFGVFSTQKTELQVMAANALEFNQETREYGPEAAHARALMRADLDWAHKQLWGDDQIKMAA